MVIKTESCAFSEYRIYPGRGQKFVAKDGRSYLFLSKKNAKMSRKKVQYFKLDQSLSYYMDYCLEKNEQEDQN